MKSGKWDISGLKKYMHIPRDHTLQWNQVDEIFLGLKNMDIPRDHTLQWNQVDEIFLGLKNICIFQEIIRVPKRFTTI